MAGELVPLVMLPRYTTYAGNFSFTTIAMDVTEFESAILNIWRGELGGGTPGVDFTCEESTDQDSWTVCAGTNTSSWDPGLNTEGQAIATLAKRWFRLKVKTAGTAPYVSCWAVGFLESRQT